MKNLTLLNQLKKVLLLGILLLAGMNASAQVQEAFAPRFNQTVKGDMTMIANNVLSRHATNNYTGSDGNHSFTNNVYVDIDNDNSTFNSSSANFSNPQPQLECLGILKAYLYWAAADKEQNNGDDNQPNWNYNDVKLMLPGQNSYTTITADDIIYRGRTSHFGNDPYICYKDITSSVAGLANPYGKYQVANVEAKTGSLESHGGGNTGTSGGWQIVFIYESPNLPSKNISIFDGYAHVTSATNNFNIDFNGFQTIPSGNVDVDVMIGSLEGDRDLSGDRLQIRNAANNFVDITAPQRSSDNFFNSRITVGNNNYTDRNPASTNTLGFDAAVFNLNNTGNSIITNNQTSARLRLASNQETYGFYLLGLSVEVWAPDMSPIVINLDSGNNPANPGDTVGFNFDIFNSGNDDAVNLAISTTLPPQVEFVAPVNLPTGVSYTYNANTGNLTFNVANNLVNVGDPALNLNFDVTIKDECYFLEDNCDLSFDLQFVATYNGVENPSLQNTLSSSGLTSCNTGNQLPLTINVNPPTPAVWATAPGELDRTIDCSDASALAAAQALEPVTDKCDFTYIKTSGEFVAEGNCPNTGKYTNTWKFSDACGNVISEYVQVITIGSPDGPSFVEALPANLAVECDEIPVAATLTATVNCGTATVTFNETSSPGACAGDYILTRTWTATDECDNETVHTQTITVTDNTAPVAPAVPADITYECIDDVPAAGSLTATDNCAGDITVTGVDTIENLEDCKIIITRTWTFTDACDNTSSVSQTITVFDTIAPDAPDAPADITYECIDDVPAAGSLTATDNCAGDITVTAVDAVNNADACNVIITRTWTFTDACDNTSSVSQTITVSDTTAPTFVETLPADITVECDVVPTAETLTASDNCGTATVTFNETSNPGTCAGNYTLTRTWTATDSCDNETVHTQTITVQGTTAPTFVEALPADIAVECDAVPTAEILTAENNCGTATVTFNETSTPGACAGDYTLTRTWTATDECDNETVHTQTITVTDNTAPVAPNAPADITYECIDDVPAAGSLTATDNCAGDITVTAVVAVNNADACNVIITRTWTFTDACDNTSSVSQTITVSDTTAPTFVETLPADITVECDVVPTAETLTASDNCGTATVTFNETSNPGTCAGNYTLTRTWTATDSCDNETVHTQTITVQGTTAPTFVEALPADIAVECDAVPTAEILTAENNCGTATVTFNETSTPGACAGDYTLTRTWTATDECDNETVHTQTITVTDNTAPVAPNAPADITYECIDDVPAAGSLTATDNCAGDITVTAVVAVNNADACNVIITRTWTFTDACDNTSSVSQTITVSDTTAPTFVETLPADITVECDVVPTAETLTASDNCGTATVTFNETSNPGACAGNYTLTRTWTATDSCDNETVHTQTITVQGTTAPTFVEALPADIAVECDAVPTAEILTAENNCGTATVTFNETSTPGACAGDYILTRTWTATDECDNETVHTQTITVTDNTAPVAPDAPADITYECIDDVPAAGSLTATDNCAGDITVTGVDTIEDFEDCKIIITRTWTFTDACDNTSSVSQTITVFDTIAPNTPDAPVNTTYECIDDVPAAGDLTATDNCAGDITVTGVDTIEALEDCKFVITRTWTFTDACDNTSSVSQIIIVFDTIAPDAPDAPADITYECIDDLPAAGNLTANDNCAGDITVTGVDAVNNADACNVIITRTWTFTDACDNTSSVSQTITVQDTTAPIIDIEAQDIVIECDGSGNNTAIQEWLDTNGGATASDNCSTNLTWTNNYNGANSDCSTPVEVIFTVTDECGNSTSTSATYSIQDTAAPTITDASNLTVECDGNGNATELQDWLTANGGATATDDCSTITWSNNFTALSDDCGLTGSATVIFTATDACGNTSETTAVFSIIDTTAPVIDVLPSETTIDCPALPEFTQAVANDTCSTDVTLTFEDVTTQGQCANAYSVTRTWTATDACGNTATASQIINVQDTTNPTIDIVANDVTVECDGQGNTQALNDWLASNGGASASDSCSTNLTWTNNFTSLSDECGATGSATVTFTATDECGNSATATATFTIEDTTNPTIDIVANDVTVECDGSGNTQALNDWLASNGGASASDSCSTNLTWTNNFTSLSDECGSTGSATVIFTATDECGNSATATATFTIEDTTNPTIDIVANDVTVECDGQGNTQALNDWLASNGGASASDSCSTNVTWTNNFTALSDECGSTGSATVTFTATDECGNSATATATFTIEDTTAPIIDIEAQDIVIECDGSGNNTAIQEWLDTNGGATATDNCSTNLTWTNNYNGANSDCSTPVEVIFTVTDECGNSTSTSATYSIQDTAAPTITDASNLTVECDGNGNATELQDWLTANGGATATDDCSTITWSNNFTALSDDCGLTGSATVIFTATDACGNTSETTAVFSIIDTTAPVIDVLPSETTIDCPALPEFTQAVANDTCSTDVTLTFEDVTTQGQCANAYSVTRTWTATDACGNTATASQIINVQDTTNPTIDIVANDVTVECDGQGNTQALNDWLASNGGASASDSCSTNLTWTNNFTSLSDECGATGSATVTFTATDECGNSATATATFTIEDTTNPTIDIVANDVTVECDGSGNTQALNDWLASNGGASASDSCSTNLTWTNNFTSLSDECGSTGSATVTFTATDECGNSATATATFTIEDTTNPTIDIVANDVTVECDGQGNTQALNDWLASNGGASASDSCSTNVTWTNNFTALSDECGSTGSATVTFTATDDCGNSATATATFTIEDTTAPTILGDFETVINVNCDAIPEIPNLTFEDACSQNMTVTGPVEDIQGDITSNYTIVREWIVSDECNNESIFTQTVNVTVNSSTQTVNTELCIDDSSIDLFDLLSSSVNSDGTWTVISGNATLNGSTFNPSSVTLGDYVFGYSETVAGQCPITYEVTVNVNDDCVVLPCTSDDVVISKTVTANNDNINEFFTVGGIETCGFTVELQIFNRWGAMIYESKNYQNNWNGFSSKASIGSSNTVPTGTYYYVINLKNSGLQPIAGPIYVATK